MQHLSRTHRSAIIRTLTAIAAATALAGFAFPATAKAEQFQSPSTNIRCFIGEGVDGAVSVACEIAQHNWVAPPRPDGCHLNWGSRFRLDQAVGTRFDCYGQSLPTPDQTLAYNSSISHGTITCYSETTDVTGSDTYTGHYFRISRESYALG
jgi:hypothetical protein